MRCWGGRTLNVTFSLDSRWSRNRYLGVISFGGESARVRFVGGGLRLGSRKIISLDTDIKVWGMFELMPAALRLLDRTGFASKITNPMIPPSKQSHSSGAKAVPEVHGIDEREGNVGAYA